MHDVTHVVYTALYEKPGVVQGWRERDQMETNLRMLKNLFEPLKAAATQLQHGRCCRAPRPTAHISNRFPLRRANAGHAISTRTFIFCKKTICASSSGARLALVNLPTPAYFWRSAQGQPQRAARHLRVRRTPQRSRSAALVSRWPALRLRSGRRRPAGALLGLGRHQPERAQRDV